VGFIKVVIEKVKAAFVDRKACVKLSDLLLYHVINDDVRMHVLKGWEEALQRLKPILRAGIMMCRDMNFVVWRWGPWRVATQEMILYVFVEAWWKQTGAWRGEGRA